MQIANRASLEPLFPLTASERYWQLAKDYPIDLVPLSQDELNSCILKILEVLFDENPVRAGAHRKSDWVSGWGRNLEQFTQTLKISDLNPGYYNKYPYIRFNSELYKTSTPNDELSSVRLLLHYVADVFFLPHSHIVELGAGTCHHLCQLAESHEPTKYYYALDWNSSTCAIARLLSERGLIQNISSFEFDFFEPHWPKSLPMPPSRSTAVYSFAALEQIGESYSQLVTFLTEQLKPALILHLEPVPELLPDNELLPYLSKQYCKKRNYLSGYLAYLKKLEDEGRLQIHTISRMPFGSLFIEGYTLIAWSPN